MATNLILRDLGSRISFEPTGGTVVLTLTSLAAGAGRISAQLDRGAGDIRDRYAGALRTQFATVPVAPEIIRMYLIEGWDFRTGGIKEGGDLPGTDSAIADEDRFIAGGILIGRLIVPPSPAADTEYISLPFDFQTIARYIQLGVWNGTVDALTATAGEHEIAMYPNARDIAAAA